MNLVTHLSNSDGRLNTHDCWKGQLPLDKTWGERLFKVIFKQICLYLDGKINVGGFSGINQMFLEILIQIFGHTDILCD